MELLHTELEIQRHDLPSRFPFGYMHELNDVFSLVSNLLYTHHVAFSLTDSRQLFSIIYSNAFRPTLDSSYYATNSPLSDVAQHHFLFDIYTIHSAVQLIILCIWNRFPKHLKLWRPFPMYSNIRRSAEFERCSNCFRSTSTWLVSCSAIFSRMCKLLSTVAMFHRSKLMCMALLRYLSPAMVLISYSDTKAENSVMLKFPLAIDHGLVKENVSLCRFDISRERGLILTSELCEDNAFLRLDVVAK